MIFTYFLSKLTILDIMKIILFSPRGYDNRTQKHSIAHLAVSLPPLGLASIAAVLRSRGQLVEIIDAAQNFKTLDSEWVDYIVKSNPDWVGFSTFTSTFEECYDICSAVREKNGAIKNVFGGVHVSWGREKILNEFKAIDYVIAGEGEYAFSDLVDQKEVSQIPGLVYRDGDKSVSAPMQSPSNLCKMDDLPFPAYDLIDGFPKKYAMPLFSYPKHPNASIVSSRGCVFNCTFCDRSVYHNSFRWNSPEYTSSLIDYLKTDFGVKHVMFYDDLFTLNRDRVSDLCTLLREKPKSKQVTFNAIVRIGHIDDDLIAELKSAGCWMVHVGIESGDQKILDAHKEGLSIEDIRRDVEKLHNAGLWVKGLFMMGFPGETEESIQKTIEFACSLPLKDANVTAFTPFPGAPITPTINEVGSCDMSRSNWKNMDCVNFVFVPNEAESKEKLEKYYGEFLSRFHSRPFARKMYNKMFIQAPHSYLRLLKNVPSYLAYLKNLKK
jgi:anaerobic magnesium-protoporphyrin IX monomethyl ester cyclase